MLRRKFSRALVVGEWRDRPVSANSVGDDIEFYTDDSRSEVLLTWHGMRQQAEEQAVEGVMRPSRCLSDFITPKESGIKDYAGLFAVTAGLGMEKRARSSSPSSTTIRELCSRRSPTASPKLLPNACTSACAKIFGAMPQ